MCFYTNSQESTFVVIQKKSFITIRYPSITLIYTIQCIHIFDQNGPSAHKARDYEREENIISFRKLYTYNFILVCLFCETL